jgi:VWFA-related protein
MIRSTRRPARRAGAACLTALVAVAGATATATEPEVQFLKPRHRATALGPTPIQLEVRVPEGARVDHVEVRANGREIARLVAPPWEIDWDAGPEGRAQTLEALLLLADGRQATALIRTSALRIDQLERVDLVNLYFVVRDRSGGYVTDLDRGDLEVQEDGVPQSIERFAATRKPLRVGIVLDTSHSMEKQERLKKSQKAAIEFLALLEPGDEAAVIPFSDRVRLPESFTADRVALTLAIAETTPEGGTALYDAIWKSSRLLEGFEDRRVMVLLSDGADEASNGLEPGSLHTLEEALDQAHRSEAIIFPIGLGRGLDQTPIRLWDRLSGRSNVDPSTSLADVLQRLATETGGRAVMSADPGRLSRAFGEIADDLRHQYSVAYASTNKERDGKWRVVRVRVPGREVEVVARRGYYAPVDRRPPEPAR